MDGLEISAKASDAVAQYNLGIYYSSELEVPDHEKAFEWWMKAAEQGLPHAQHNVGTCYEEGKGVSQDLFKAAEWYMKAAEQGYGLAQNNLGFCYITGLGVLRDLIEATIWWTRAAENGCDESRNNLDRLRGERTVCRFKGNIWWRLGKENVMVCCAEMLRALNWISKNVIEVEWIVDTECPFCGGVGVRRETEGKP
jgi:hypothetical protein